MMGKMKLSPTVAEGSSSLFVGTWTDISNFKNPPQITGLGAYSRCNNYRLSFKPNVKHGPHEAWLNKSVYGLNTNRLNLSVPIKGGDQVRGIPI